MRKEVSQKEEQKSGGWAVNTCLEEHSQPGGIGGRWTDGRAEGKRPEESWWEEERPPNLFAMRESSSPHVSASLWEMVRNGEENRIKANYFISTGTLHYI